MKLSAYKTLESSKRAQTLSRIILIAGAHLVIIGGAYLVTTFGDKPSDDSVALAGVGTWSNQSPTASEPSVDASSSTLFDSRASSLGGYNAGEGKPVMLANNSSSPSSSDAGRYAPRRPSSSSDLNNSASSPSPSTARSPSSDDGFLSPIGRSGEELYPDRPSSVGSAGLSQSIEYKVQNGDSLWGIGQRFKVDVKDITAVNPGLTVNIRAGQTINIPRTPDSTSVDYQPTPSSSAPNTSPANGSIYTVKAGDVLSTIASRQGLTVAELKRANGLRNDVIRIGQELVIPTRTNSSTLVSNQHRGPKVTVEAGDSLSKFAAIYGVSVSELMELNDITNKRMIRIGQVLLIPEDGQSRISSPESSAPVRQPASQPRVTQPRSTPPARTLPTLEELPQDRVPPTLPTLDEAFGEEDLEDQPLIQISE